MEKFYVLTLILLSLSAAYTGPYVMQVMDSCVLRDDGTIVGSKQFRYDGEEYMYLDMQSGTFIPTRTEARVTTHRWNSPDLRIGERRKNYLENKCIDRLKKFLELGKEYLERRVQPKVKVSGRESGDTTKLHCVVYGFHPRAVDVRWMKNGVDDVPTYETTHVLPNPDGTYQIRVSVEVISNEVDTYLCYVDHSSLEEPLLVPWELKQNFSRAVIFSVMVTILLVLSSVVVGVILYKRKEVDYTSVTKPKQISSWPPVVIGGTVITVLLLTSVIGAVIIYK
ncbi:class I histocompatibility antigen, F10 alpha chain-like [Engystomops pustulosus]|uniref:class I histocompatibility antigen, F10 alpha chain-like n=1 Tax=Engystomops pustulosus TaxID=76066 RepID=UPI003AFAE179